MTTSPSTGSTSTANPVGVHVFANGDMMPLLGLGTWKSEPGEVNAAVREAIRIGYRHIDCAALYGNEVEVGNAIRDAISDGDVAREDLFITSKLWSNAHGRENVEPALRKSLSDLGLDDVDLYQIHWPIALDPSVVLPGMAADVLRPPKRSSTRRGRGWNGSRPQA